MKWGYGTDKLFRKNSLNGLVFLPFIAHFTDNICSRQVIGDYNLLSGSFFSKTCISFVHVNAIKNHLEKINVSLEL